MLVEASMRPASVPLWLGKRPARHTRHGLAWRQRCIANLKNATYRAEGRTEGRMWLDGAAAGPMRPIGLRTGRIRYRCNHPTPHL